MAKRGSKPQSAELRVLKGFPGGRPVPPKKIQPSSETYPTPPNFVQDRALEIWKEKTPELSRLGYLTKPDYYAFGRYCDMLANYELASANCRKLEDMIVVKDDGIELLSATFKIMKELNTPLQKFESVFGLTVSARTGIEVEKASRGGKTQDELDNEGDAFAPD